MISFLTHGAEFDKADMEINGYRLAFTIRWLASAKDFYVDTCGMRLDKRAQETVAGRKNWRRADDVFRQHSKSIYT